MENSADNSKHGKAAPKASAPIATAPITMPVKIAKSEAGVASRTVALVKATMKATVANAKKAEKAAEKSDDPVRKKAATKAAAAVLTAKKEVAAAKVVETMAKTAKTKKDTEGDGASKHLIPNIKGSLHPLAGRVNTEMNKTYVLPRCRHAHIALY